MVEQKKHPDVTEPAASEHTQGYLGDAPDPTPNDHYTVAGVTAGKPTPETDEKLRAKARTASRRHY